MATAEMIIQLSDTDRELIRRLTDALEGARPPRSNSVEPFVGPPDANQGEPAALARPATIPELKTWLKDKLRAVKESGVQGVNTPLVVEWLNFILQQLKDLDQGPIAKPCSKPKSPKQCPPHQYR